VVNRTGCAVLLVEQFVHLALKHTARAYVLAKGQVAVEGASRDLLSSPEVMAAYLGEVAKEDRTSARKPVRMTRRSGERPAQQRRARSSAKTKA